MAYTILYHPAVQREDIPKLSRAIQLRIQHAIEARLTTAPEKYGKPLRRTLKNYWKLRIGDYRIVFKVVGTEIWILGIGHREIIYQAALGRV